MGLQLHVLRLGLESQQPKDESRQLTIQGARSAVAKPNTQHDSAIEPKPETCQVMPIVVMHLSMSLTLQHHEYGATFAPQQPSHVTSWLVGIVTD